MVVFGVLRALSIAMPLAPIDVSMAIAQIAEPTTLGADIPAQPLAEALAAFARQTGLHVVYVFEVVRNKKSNAVPAGLSAEEALARLLQGTGLKFEFLTPHSVRILAAPGLAAQSPLAPDESQVPLGEVIITGSRIPVPANITAAGPLVVVSADDILRAGYTDTVDVISALPQMTTTVSADLGGSSVGFGTATADLRGLGPQRTVVLINGRRLGVGDPNTGNPNSAPDLDQIPLAMVERVEVLTGGSTVTYGSDAIAGVVNFILKDHVQGVQIDGQYGIAQHTQQNTYLQSIEAAAGITPPVGTILDGARRDLSILAGTELDGGAAQVTGYFIYHDQNPVYGSERDFADCTAFYKNGVPTQPGYKCGGSLNSNLFGPDAGFGANYSVVGNQFVPFPAAGSVPPSLFNSAPYVNLQRRDTRYQAGVLAHFDLNPAAKPYFEFSFMSDHTLTEAAPSGLFTGADSLTPDGNYLVNCSNPLLSAEEAAILCTPAEIAADKVHPGSVSADVLIGRRNIEGGGRQFSFEHRNYRAVAGIDGKLGAAWSYSAYALYYYTSLFHASENNLNLAAVNDALQVTTNQSGRPVCISGGSCVPYNIFTTGAVTPQQLAYLYVPGTDSGSNSEQILEADVTGQLARYGLITPWAREGVAINAGAEHRTEALGFAPDAAELSGDLSGGPAAVAIDKRVSVDEGFLEMRVPIAQDQPLARDLTIGAGYRHSHYSTAGVTNTYKFDLQFAPMVDVRLRATYDRVVRAPNLIELYTPLSYGSSLTVGIDPCAPTTGGATHATASLAQCMRMGVTAAEYGNGFGPAVGGTSTLVQCVSQICGAVAGGNPQLAPETADTWSVGLTFTPTAIPSLTGSLDYFHILLKGEIAPIPGAITLQQCLATGEPTWCSQIVRTPAGDLSGSSVAGGGYILERDVNTGAALVSGMDIQMNYLQRLAARWGALRVSLNGSWLQHNTSTPYQSAPSYDCAGLFGSTCLGGSASPRWRHNLRVTWQTPWNVQLSVQWRYIGRTDFDNNSSQPLLQNQEEGFFDPLLTHIPSYSYLDLSAIWNVTRHVQVRAGVNNVFDKDPPFLPAEASLSGDIFTLPPYDILGRYIYMGVGATF